MLAMAAVLPTRPESQSCQCLTQARKFFGRSSRARVNYAALRARKITEGFRATAVAGTEQWNFRGVSTAGDLAGCFSSNRPGAITTVIFCGAADRLDATNFDTALPYRGYLPFATTPRRIRSRRLQRFGTASQFTRFESRPNRETIIRLHRNRAVR